MKPRHRESEAGLGEALARQARAFNPAPPEDMRRRVMGRVIALGDCGRSPRLGWRSICWTAGGAVVLAAAFFIFRQHGSSHLAQSPSPARQPAPTMASWTLVLPRLSSDPLEGEWEALRTDCTHWGQTVGSVLPSLRSERPTTRPRGAGPA